MTLKGKLRLLGDAGGSVFKSGLSHNLFIMYI